MSLLSFPAWSFSYLDSFSPFFFYGYHYGTHYLVFPIKSIARRSSAILNCAELGRNGFFSAAVVVPRVEEVVGVGKDAIGQSCALLLSRGPRSCPRTIPVLLFARPWATRTIKSLVTGPLHSLSTATTLISRTEASSDIAPPIRGSTYGWMRREDSCRDPEEFDLGRKTGICLCDEMRRSGMNFTWRRLFHPHQAMIVFSLSLW